jgi:1-deoxy-D-xylulose-5-phosphate reductoisomerase
MNEGGSLPVTLNAANEVAVEAFLQEQIRFDQIPGLVGSVMETAERLVVESLEDVIESDTMARQHANANLKRLI